MDLLPKDTSLEASRIQTGILRKLSIEQRLIQVFQLGSSLRETNKTGIRLRHPEYTEEQVRFAAIRLSLGDELFRKAYPHIHVRP
jgi:hypothetical protein